MKVDSLPEDIRRQETDFIEFLLARREKPEPVKKKRPIGLMKGQIRMADDLDDPLEEFMEGSASGAFASLNNEEDLKERYE